MHMAHHHQDSHHSHHGDEHSGIDDELWGEFHHYVNMSSRELEDWLRELTLGNTLDAD